jgi:hypothetical protein
MDRPKLIRRLRFNLSALCLLLCVAFIVLWVRSHWWFDYVHFPWPGKSTNPSSRRTAWLPDGTQFEPSPRMFMGQSSRGRLALFAGEQNPTYRSAFPWGWGMTSDYIYSTPKGQKYRTKKRKTWDYSADRYGRHILFPHWAPALVFGALAALSFGIRPFRYGLKTLLITSTVVAVTLGLIMWARGE